MANPIKNVEVFDDSSENRLLVQLYDKIINNDLTTFESLKNSVSKMKVTPRLRKVLFKAFNLQRELHWGFFKELSPKTFPKLWQVIVMPDTTFKFAGDLKRSMSIPEIYMGLLDIHGYTKYCNDKKRNMSMIDLLDRMIYEDVNAICKESGVLSKRAQGDEILLMGASAQDVFKSVLQIMDYFNSQGRSFRNTVLSRKLPGTVLPKFQISAGIAGGQKFTPLVITRDGDISGDIVNTAARLQSKANKISPEQNRIMITNHVYQRFRISIKDRPDEFFSRIDFFNTGTVEFKGVRLNVYDIVFLPEGECRLKLVDSMERLYHSLDKKMWKNKILIDALDVVVVIIKNYLEEGCRDTTAGRKLQDTCHELLELTKSVRTMFNAMYFDAALKTYSMLVDNLVKIPGVDKIALEYLQLVQRNYKTIKIKYLEFLDYEIELMLNEIYSPKEKDDYMMLKKHWQMYEKVRSNTRLKLNNRKKIWLRTADEINETLNINLQSFK